jgi:hypothetical protein
VDQCCPQIVPKTQVRHGLHRVPQRQLAGDISLKNEKRSFTVGEVDAADAAVYKASTEELLRLLKRNLISSIPEDLPGPPLRT